MHISEENTVQSQNRGRRLRRKAALGAAAVTVVGAVVAVTGLAHAETTNGVVRPAKGRFPTFSVKVYNAGAFTGWAVVYDNDAQTGTIPRYGDGDGTAPDIQAQETAESILALHPGSHYTIQGGARAGRSMTLDFTAPAPQEGHVYCFRLDGTTQVAFDFSQTDC